MYYDDALKHMFEKIFILKSLLLHVLLLFVLV